MKSKKYAISFVTFALLIMAFDVVICQLVFPALSIPASSLLNAFIFVLFCSGILIIAPALDKDPATFVNRFVLLTSVQVIFFLFFFAVIIYAKAVSSRLVIFNALSFFIACVFLQSILLLKWSKK